MDATETVAVSIMTIIRNVIFCNSLFLWSYTENAPTLSNMMYNIFEGSTLSL